ncbi:sensor histidine kinase [Saccharothrix obliqua]|uniref:sensor histidine kinase n=1 Tax=Saccharothrix obliqua TaxID=2861747 RepID=UPI001C60059F|nr:histidine kinase [Saccharothrix obliqua]MBW4720614.1 histidine kinase [Saccharothrix obliqua]
MRFLLGSLAVASVAAQTTALAMATNVPVWAVLVVLAAGVTAFAAGRRVPARPALVVLAATTPVVPLVDHDVWPTALVLLAVGVVFPWLIGHSARQQAELAALATERVHLAERTRIAHEAHDTLGHDLSLLALRAGVLELAADLPDHHRAAAGDLRVAAGRATENLADLVALLRGDAPPPLHPPTEEVADLVARAADAGLAVTLDWPDTRALPPPTARAVHRIVQEALTNAAKHAPDAPVRITVTTTPDTTVVRVRNPTTGTRRAPGAGTGLTALRERARLAGGTIETTHRDQVFELVATLPNTGDT